MTDEIKAIYDQKIKRVNDAIELKEPDRVPVAPCANSLPYFLSEDTVFQDSMYNYDKAVDAIVKYYSHYDQDAIMYIGLTSGKANELAGTSQIDWPGRPGSIVAPTSSHQVIEHEFMTPEEYPELLRDYTGFMMKKYIPRAFTNLTGLKSFNLNPATILNASFLSGIYNPDVLSAFKLLEQIGGYDAEAAAASAAVNERLGEMGMPPFMTGISEAPFDILSDYFRGTIGAMEDQLEYPDYVAAACDMFADQQIEQLAWMKDADLPVKRIFFPLHKAMDGFMGPDDFQEIYWKPLKKIMLALIDMDVTPYIYTEGRYDTRLEAMTDIPKGKVIYHFETADMKRAKQILGDVACISGNLPIYLLEYGTKEQVADYVKYLIDNCAGGGGYIFDTNAGIDNAKRENVDIMFETAYTYGKK